MGKASSSHSGHPRESPVWNFYLYDRAKGKSICQVESGVAGSVCRMEINGKYPTNLKVHLKAKHPESYIELCKLDEEVKEKAKQKPDHVGKSATQLSIEDAVKRTKKYTKESEKYQRITQKLAKFVGIGYVANLIVDNKEFRDLMAEIDDRYISQSCFYFKRNGQDIHGFESVAYVCTSRFPEDVAHCRHLVKKGHDCFILGSDSTLFLHALTINGEMRPLL